MRRIDGMGVAITGASSGIGAALARELHRRGARLVLAARSAERLDLVARELPGVEVVVADVADPADCVRIAAAGGRIDTLVCNAGHGLARPVVETSLGEWEAILRTNLLGTTACIAAAVPRMRAQAPRDGWHGQVVIVSSALARRAKPDAGAYSATKAAQLSVAEALRVELAHERIAVTSVHPVRTATAFAGSTRGDPQRVTAIGTQQSAEQVARRIADAIARPRPEVWPHRASRWGLALATLWPALVDRAMAARRAPG